MEDLKQSNGFSRISKDRWTQTKCVCRCSASETNQRGSTYFERHKFEMKLTSSESLPGYRPS